MEELDTSPANKILGLFSNSELPSNDRSPSLKQMTEKAINVLNTNSERFLLMIEGSQIDWGGHANVGEYVIEETLDFDKTIGVALDYAVKHGNTLVVVTADHETGGFTLAAEQSVGPFKTINRDYNSIVPTFSTGGHSCTMVPVFAYGTFSDHFSGVFENTKLYSIFKEITSK